MRMFLSRVRDVILASVRALWKGAAANETGTSNGGFPMSKGDLGGLGHRPSEGFAKDFSRNGHCTLVLVAPPRAHFPPTRPLDGPEAA